MSALSVLRSSSNLVLQSSLALLLTLILSYLRIPALFLHGVNTYIHPDDVNPATKPSHGARAMIRRPGGMDSDFKPKRKSKDKFEFDESKAQIFRLKLSDSHLQTRVYFNQFCGAFNSTLVAGCCLLLHKFLPTSNESGFIANGCLVPILLGLSAVCRILLLIARISFELSASRRLERQSSFIVGVSGFVIGLLILFETIPEWFIDFRFGSLDGLGKTLIATLMGCTVGFLYMPALRNARAFWLGTDQIRCNLSIISYGYIVRMLLYASYLLSAFTSLLWINPLAEIFVNKNIGSNSKGSQLMGSVGRASRLVGHVGMSRSEFEKFRVWCLMISGLLQVLVLRSNVQTYLNEAVLCWYQRLHASKVPNLDYSRAKVFLHNHFLCLVVVQFLAPPALVLLLLGLSQLNVNFSENFQVACSLLPCAALSDVALFLAWWVVLAWTAFSSGVLLLYRFGILYVA